MRGELDSAGFGGDIIGTWSEGTFVIPKRYRECAYEIVDGERVIMGWASYEDMCRSPEVLERHGLTLKESMRFFKKHTRLIELRKVNEVHEAVDWKTWYHPEIYRRRKLPGLLGRAMTSDDLAKEFDEEAAETPGPTVKELRAQAKRDGFKNASNMNKPELLELLS